MSTQTDNQTDPLKTADTSVHDFEANSLKGERVALADYRGQVLLIVNTASACGFTPQYADLESLQQKFADRGFAVLAFPCNQFGKQEPGDAQQIGAFCASRFSVSFPLFDKIEVNGDTAHPLYRFLKQQAPGLLGTQAVKWNFTKFLVDQNGRVIRRYAPATNPARIAGDIEDLLDQASR